MNHQYLRKTSWSNLFFLIPFVLSLKLEIFYYSLVLGIMIAISMLFHYSNNFKLRYLDIFISSILIVSNLYLLSIGGWKLPFSLITILIAILAIIVYYLQFKSHRILFHNIWHVLAATICYFSILTFLN